MREGLVVRRLLRGLVGAVACMLWLAGTPADAQTAARFVVDAGHSVRVGSIKFSPDGRYMASYDFTGKIVVRDLRSGAPVAELQGDEGYMTMGGGRLGGAMDFSPDGRWFALGTTDEASSEGRVSLRAVGSFREVFSARVHGLTPTEPRGLHDLAFMANGDLVTVSQADRERGGKAQARAWQLGGNALVPVPIARHQAMLRSGSTGDQLRDPAGQRPPGLADLRDSCQRADGSGVALQRSGGVLTWSAAGTPTPAAVQPPPLGQDDMVALHCMAGAPGAWLVVGRDVKDQPGQPKIWLSDKTLYSWLPGQPQWQRVQRLGAVGLNDAAAVRGGADLMANLNNRLWRFRPGVAGPVAELPTSAGRIESISSLDGGNRLSVTAVYSIFLGGEYTPEIYPSSERVFDLRSGRQTAWSDSADCGRLGAVNPACASYDDQRPAAEPSPGPGAAPAAAMPPALAAKGLARQHVLRSSPDGQRLIAEQVVKQRDGQSNTTLWWHDRSTGQTQALDAPLPNTSEFTSGQWLSPELDLLTLGLGEDGKPAWPSDVRRIALVRLADRQTVGAWPVPATHEDQVVGGQRERRLLLTVRKDRQTAREELIVRRFDGTAVFQRALPPARAHLDFDAAGTALWLLEPLGPGRARVHRIGLAAGSTTSTTEVAVAGQALSFAAVGERALAVGTSNGAVHLVDRGGRELATAFFFPEGQWLTLLPSGYFMASSQNMAARLYATDSQGQRYRLDALEERFYRPDLVQMALAGQPLPPHLATVDALKPAPALAVVDAPAQVPGDAVELQLRLTDRGGGVGEVRAFVNGSAVAQAAARDLGVAAVAAGQLRRLPLRLARGDNEVRIVAFNADGSMASEPVTVRVRSLQTTERKPALHALVVGINEFENPRLKLNYAVTDATAVAAVLRQRAQGLFGAVNVTLLTRREDTRREALLAALQRHSQVAPDDVFLLYIASHGTVEGDDLATKEYFLVTSNVGALSERALRRDAVSQRELKSALAAIPATKKVIILDTCHSGAFGDPGAVATRGMAEEGALKVLSRAAGIVVLSASTSQQQALEGHQGHGLYSYVLLQGLSGKADARGNGFVNTGALADYLEDEVPRLAERYQRKQYPTRFWDGQSFPLVLSR